MGTVILAGHPQMAFYVLFAALCYAVWRGLTGSQPLLRRFLNTAAWGLIAGTVALSLSAVQLLPTAEFVRHSHRAALPGLEGLRAYVKFALPWQHLVTLMLPDFFGNPSAGTYASVGNYAEYVAYAGVLPLVFAPFALKRERRGSSIFFAILAVVALLIALGTSLNAVLYFLVPGFKGTGGPARMLFLYMASVSILGGLGADALLQRTDKSAPRRMLTSAAGWLAVTAAFAVGAWLAHPVLVRLSAGQFAAYLAGNSAVLVCSVGVALAMLVLASRKIVGAQTLGGVLLVMLLFDLLSFGMDYSPTAPRSSVYPNTEGIAYLQAHARNGRILPLYKTWPLNDFPQAVMPPNSAMAYGLYDVQGYDSIYLAGYKSLLAEVVGHDPSPPANGNMLLADAFSPALLDVLGVSRVLSLARIPQLKMAQMGDVFVHEREGARGVAYVTDDFVPVNSASEAVEGLRGFAQSGAAAQPPTFVQNAGLQPVPNPSTAAASVRRQSPNRAIVTASFPKRGYLVLTENAYPGWRVRVDGRPAPIRIANGTFRAVPFPPGRHDVEFTYQPTSFRLGLFISLLCVALLAGCLSSRIRRAVDQATA
jgi:hypothetical protein